MVRDIKEFSDEQRQFLNVLYALSGPVPVQVAGVLAPLLPGPLFELIDQGRDVKRRLHGANILAALGAYKY